jgi:hypothetical protein
MAMDDRQSQIRTQAGLTESRLNEDFIEFLRKYSTPALLVVAIAAAGFFAFKKYQEREAQKLDSAFAELASLSRGEVSPEAATAIADLHDGVESVSSLALLEAADVHLRTATRGVKLGTTVSSDGSLIAPEDALTSEELAAELAAAKNLYDRVVAANPDRDRAAIRINAMFGLAAVAECKNDFAQARQIYQQIESQSNTAGYEANAQIAKARAESLTALEALPPLISRSELPAAPVPPMLELPPMPVMPTPSVDVTDPAAPTDPAPSDPAPAAPAAPTEPATPAANP